MSEPLALSADLRARALRWRSGLLAGVTRLGIVLVLSFIAVIAIYPIVFMGLSSFRTSLEYLADPLGLPTGFSYIDNFVAMYYRFDLPRLFLNTVIYILLASAITLAVSVPASFTFAKARFPARDGLRAAMIATLIMPPVTFLVPSYVMMANLGIIDTPLPVVLLWAATSVPGSIFLLSALMRAIPSEMLEAARHRRRGLPGDAAADRAAAEPAGDHHGDDLQHHRLVERPADSAGLHRAGGEDDADRRRGDDRSPLQHGLPAGPHRAVPRLAAADRGLHRPAALHPARAGAGRGEVASRDVEMKS